VITLNTKGSLFVGETPADRKLISFEFSESFSTTKCQFQ